MDIRATRMAIAAAMSTVSRITGYERRPRTIRAYDAWPLWRSAERSNAGFSYIQTFAVVIALPGGDEAQADEFVDTYADDIVNALERSAMSVTTIQPSVLGTEGGDMLAVMITGRSE